MIRKREVTESSQDTEQSVNDGSLRKKKTKKLNLGVQSENPDSSLLGVESELLTTEEKS